MANAQRGPRQKRRSGRQPHIQLQLKFKSVAQQQEYFCARYSRTTPVRAEGWKRSIRPSGCGGDCSPPSSPPISKSHVVNPGISDAETVRPAIHDSAQSRGSFAERSDVGRKTHTGRFPACFPPANQPYQIEGATSGTSGVIVVKTYVSKRWRLSPGGFPAQIAAGIK